MKIMIRTLTGKSIALEIEPSNSIMQVKRLIETKTGMPTDHIRLLLRGCELRDRLTLEEAQINDGEIIDFFLRLGH